MSDLVATAYPDKETAETVRATLGRLRTEHVIVLDDAVVVTRDENGKVHLHQAVNPAGAGAATGAVWGGLIGLLFLAPLLGMAVGAATGGVAGAVSDFGIEDNFMKELGAKLERGGAALIVLIHDITPDKVLPQIQQYGGEVLQTSLSDDAEARLQEALRESPPAAA